MTGITAEIAQQHLNEWLSADSATAAGQSYSMGDRTLTRADAKEIRENIIFWNNMVIKLGGESRAMAFNVGIPGRY